MDAIQFTSKDKQITLAKIPIPEVTHPREVLVKVAFSGVCGTDLHIINGEFPCNPNSLTLGHEFSATVVDFGREVTTLTRGDKVVVDPNSGCHTCHFCHIGHPHFCLNVGFYANLGVKNHGGWAEYCLCSIEQVHKIPNHITLKAAALAEPLSCISHGWDLIAPVPIGGEILVIGAGIIGTLWLCLLHLHGHRRVTVVEINQKRRKLLGELLKITDFNLMTPQELDTCNKLFDLVIDCSGYGPIIETGFKMLNSGGKICMFGVTPPDVKVKISPFEIYMKELTILSVKINPFSFPKAISLVEALGDKYLDYHVLGVKAFRLGEFSEAVQLLKAGDITKAIFQI